MALDRESSPPAPSPLARLQENWSVSLVVQLRAAPIQADRAPRKDSLVWSSVFRRRHPLRTFPKKHGRSQTIFQRVNPSIPNLHWTLRRSGMFGRACPPVIHIRPGPAFASRRLSAGESGQWVEREGSDKPSLARPATDSVRQVPGQGDGPHTPTRYQLPCGIESTEHLTRLGRV